MQVGYARVSTVDQNLDLQRDALTKAGCERIFEEKKSGRAGTKRPELDAALASPVGDARTTRVFLATAHLDHDPGNSRPRNLAALCQRCHMLHDRAEHQRRRWITLRARKAVGDLFLGPYSNDFPFS